MTNTYQASVDGFVKYLGLTEEESYDLIKKSVKYTKIACERFAKEYPDISKFINQYLNFLIVLLKLLITLDSCNTPNKYKDSIFLMLIISVYYCI